MTNNSWEKYSGQNAWAKEVRDAILDFSISKVEKCIVENGYDINSSVCFE